MVALTRADVDDLNARASERLEALGVLDPGRDRTDAGPCLVGVGERVMALRNDRRAGLVNGTVGTVTAVHPDGSVTVAPEAAASVPIRVPVAYLEAGWLTQGWAITAHEAQGITTGKAFLLGTDRLYREAGYVALSRATDRTDWYQPAPSPPSWASAVTVDTDLVRLLGRSAAQQLAITPPSLQRPQPGGRPDPRLAAGMRAAVLTDPAEHLVAALGPPPLAGAARDTWTAAALTVEIYRYRHGITGPDPLGPTPRSGQLDQQREWLTARVAITDARRALGRDHALGIGLGL